MITRTTLGSLVTLVGVAALMVTTALPAIADDGLDDLLEGIEEAEFSGSQVIITTWDGVTEVSVVTIDHSGDVTIVEGGDGVAMLGQGRAMRSGSDNGAAVSAWTDVASERYHTVLAGRTVRQGRDVQHVEIREGELLRARVTVDIESGAPLVSEVFDVDGRRFRYSAMLDFAPWSQGLEGPISPVFDVSLPAPVTSTAYGELAGYMQADTYAAPDESLHSFFTDGLFSFSLFEFGTAVSIEDDTLTTFQIAGREYRRRVTATDVYVTWQASSTTYVLVGDLPPDHLEDVLTELPRPRRRGFLSRLWSGLFR